MTAVGTSLIPSWLSILFLLLITFAKTSDFDYCKISNVHTMCVYKAISKNCVQYRTQNENAVRLMINDHNMARSKFAGGRKGYFIPNMMKMYWDQELADLSARWACQCKGSLDADRGVSRFEVGQVVWTIMDPQNFTKWKNIWKYIIEGGTGFYQRDNWGRMVTNYDPSDPLSLIYNPYVRFMGCTLAKYLVWSVEVSSFAYTTTLVCNYGPVLESYEKYPNEDWPCRDCPKGKPCFTKFYMRGNVMPPNLPNERNLCIDPVLEYQYPRPGKPCPVDLHDAAQGLHFGGRGNLKKPPIVRKKQNMGQGSLEQTSGKDGETRVKPEPPPWAVKNNQSKQSSQTTENDEEVWSMPSRGSVSPDPDDYDYADEPSEKTTSNGTEFSPILDPETPPVSTTPTPKKTGPSSVSTTTTIEVSTNDHGNSENTTNLANVCWCKYAVSTVTDDYYTCRMLWGPGNVSTLTDMSTQAGVYDISVYFSHKAWRDRKHVNCNGYLHGSLGVHDPSEEEYDYHGPIDLDGHINFCELSCVVHAPHTLCSYNTTSPDCGQFTSLTNAMTEEDLLLLHNEFRNMYTEGKTYPPHPLASNMARLKWSKELRASADMWLRQCKLKHDECKDAILQHPATGIGRIFRVSQNMGWKYYNLNETCPSHRDLFEQWKAQAYNFSGRTVEDYLSYSDDGRSKVDDFVQLIWARTHYVGCAYGSFSEPNSTRGVAMLICNYAPLGKEVSKHIYIPGGPCSNCFTETEFKQGHCFMAEYPNLCDTGVVPQPPAAFFIFLRIYLATCMLRDF